MNGTALIVDDEPLIRRGYALRLREVGHDAVEAASVTEALEIIHKRAFDVVITDLHMPGRGGIDLLVELRRTHPDLPVILMTADPSLESALAALDLEVLGYLPKPVAPQRLRALVSRAIQLAQLARARREAQRSLMAPSTRNHENQAAFDLVLESVYPAFQPIVRWPGGEAVAHEALLRVSRPEGWGPGEVLALAERTGAIHALGRRMRERVAAEMGTFPPTHRVFVNLHAEDLLDPELYHRDAPLSSWADRVTLELTERAALDHIDNIGNRIRRLRSLGYQIAIDDLGAGYSGLSCLINLEPNVVKLDMQLVRGLDQHPARRQLVGAITRLTGDMNIGLIAEGVETPGERDALAELGVERMQGFLFGRPAPVKGATS